MFYSNEHAPIHVHGKHNGQECKAELIISNGAVVSIIFIPVETGLEHNKQKDFEAFVKIYADEIVTKWIDFFVYKKTIQSQTITRKI